LAGCFTAHKIISPFTFLVLLFQIRPIKLRPEITALIGRGDAGRTKRMNKLRTLIIDDEWLIRLELRKMLGQYPNIDVVGEAANIAEAVHAIKEIKPDLVFLDIQMPGGSGFDLLEQVEINFKIIFVTAYTQHFTRATKYQAIDYLLKPISQERLARAMQELSKCLHSEEEKP
jgi:two-component system LytT family response regulator